MQVRVKSISVLQAGKISAVIYSSLAIVMIPFMLIPLAWGQGSAFDWIFIGFIFLYPVLGFIGGIIGAAIYNLAARFVGGMEIVLETIESVPPVTVSAQEDVPREPEGL